MGYPPYFDIFKTVYQENKTRSSLERVRIVLVDRSYDALDVNSYFRKIIEESSFAKDNRMGAIGALADGMIDRDMFMARMIEMCRYTLNMPKGVFFVGSAHVQKNLQEKGQGRRYFASGGILASTLSLE